MTCLVVISVLPKCGFPQRMSCFALRKNAKSHFLQAFLWTYVLSNVSTGLVQHSTHEAFGKRSRIHLTYPTHTSNNSNSTTSWFVSSQETFDVARSTRWIWEAFTSGLYLPNLPCRCQQRADRSVQLQGHCATLRRRDGWEDARTPQTISSSPWEEWWTLGWIFYQYSDMIQYHITSFTL